MDRRIPMIAGIAFAALYAAALLMVPTLPGIDKPGYDIVSHVNEHSGAMRIQPLLVTFGSLALVVVLGYARDRLAGPSGYVFTIGSAVVIVELGIAMWFTGGLALHPDQLGSATARTVTDIVTMWGPILTAAYIMVAVPILLAANDGRFPRWLGIIAAVFAVEQLIETITIIGPPGSFISPGGAMNFYLGGPLFILFFVALGVALSLQAPVTKDAEATDAATRFASVECGVDARFAQEKRASTPHSRPKIRPHEADNPADEQRRRAGADRQQGLPGARRRGGRHQPRSGVPADAHPRTHPAT